MFKQKLTNSNRGIDSFQSLLKSMKLSSITWMLEIILITASIFPWCACQDQTPRPQQTISEKHQNRLSDHEKNTIHRFQQASPSVVHITSVSLLRSRFSLSMYEREEGTANMCTRIQAHRCRPQAAPGAAARRTLRGGVVDPVPGRADDGRRAGDFAGDIPVRESRFGVTIFAN